ncbi:MAG: AmmeMemoRadiSam system radical SAM enzyme [Candidatus Omnitrophota bacterium]|nr:AmmeMemoRadiSam system radical SAM enzyme [Candidatus Omnitrophota bacterium]
MLKEALLYKKLEDEKVSCYLCSHHCLILDGRFGICGVRENKEGTLFTHAYGSVIAAHIDPIEKKPLFHVMPGSMSFSIAAIGCNFRCGFCQNWQISQKQEAQNLGLVPQAMEPLEVVKLARKAGCESISYTYTEPSIFFEYALEIAKLAKEQGLLNIFVTNGYMTKEALEMIKPYLDAANVDLKFFKDDSYKKVCNARLFPVLESIKLMHAMGIWQEITTLVVPTLNDSQGELEDIANFIASVGIEMPWHISRFHPDYKLIDNEPTSVTSLKLAESLGRKANLRYVYLGNIPPEGENTYCYKCGKLLIKRFGFEVLEQRLKDSKCSYCQTKIEGLYLD